MTCPPIKRILLALLFLSSILFTAQAQPAAAGGSQTYTVNLASDEADISLADNRCDVDLGTSGDQCTLRAAIQQANNTSDQDVIEFRVGLIIGPAYTIKPQSELPAIREPVIIDGTTQPQPIPPFGDPLTACAAGADDTHNILITLDGSEQGSGAGLRFNSTANASQLRGLAIINFGFHGMIINANNMQLDCLHVGVERDGETAAGNGGSGILLSGALNNTIGGTSPSQRNVISDNSSWGISFDFNSNGNRIEGNYIGLDEDGESALGNDKSGIRIRDSSDNTIGGTSSTRRNLISGNGVHGIEISVANPSRVAENNVIQDNYIGTDVTGSNAFGNAEDGIYLSGAGDTAIGRFIIGGSSNLISGNGQHGIRLANDTSGTTIENNIIGSRASETLPLPNFGDGIHVAASDDNNIGGTILGNRITYNRGNGVHIRDNSSDNTVLNNIIRNNIANGILLDGTSGVTIGDSGDGNVIGSNSNNGIEISGAASESIVIQGNEIGVDTSGSATVADANAENGIFISHVDGVVIGYQDELRGGGGGVGSSTSNIISSNGVNGIYLSGSDVQNVQIDQNYIGTDVTESAELGNDGHGILIDDGASGSLIGYFGANTIAFNSNDGIAVVGSATTGHAARFNSIYDNGGLGLDLGNDGVTINDVGDGDSGPNKLTNFPELTSRSWTPTAIMVSGKIDVGISATVVVDFYSNSSCDDGYGEAERWLGETTVATGVDGTGTFSVTLNESVASGHFLSMQADVNSNASEFSRCVELSSVPLSVGLAESKSSPATVSLLPLLFALVGVTLLVRSRFVKRRLL